jgi:hypothetical protein
MRSARTFRRSGWYWVRFVHYPDNPAEIAKWDANTLSWQEIGNSSTFGDENYSIVNGPLSFDEYSAFEEDRAPQPLRSGERAMIVREWPEMVGRTGDVVEIERTETGTRGDFVFVARGGFVERCPADGLARVSDVLKNAGY